MTTEITTQKLFESFAGAFGQNNARRIFGAVHEAVAFANEQIQPPEPVDTVVLGLVAEKSIAQCQFSVLGEHNGWTSFGITFNRRPVPRILQRIWPTAVHETTHVASFQHGVLSGEYENNDQFTLFDCVISEGRSTHAEVVLLGSSDFHYAAAPTGLLRQGLSDALSAGKFDDEDMYAFLEGNGGFAGIGYHIGHFVVAATADKYDLDIHEVIKLPNKAYREVAESLV